MDEATARKEAERLYEVLALEYGFSCTPFEDEKEKDKGTTQMTTPSAIAREIVAYCDLYTHMTITRQELLDKIDELVLQDARQPVAIDGKQLNEIAAEAVKHYEDIDGEAFDAYREGFLECARRNAAVVRWPSEEEMQLAKLNSLSATSGRGVWEEACSWLKQRVMGERK